MPKKNIKYMDKEFDNTLIANSGLHFKTTRLRLNPEEPMLIGGGKTLKYTFLETIDFLNDQRVRFDVCTTKDGLYSPVNYMEQTDNLEKTQAGVLVLDETGVPRVNSGAVMALCECYPSDSPELVSINSLGSYRVKKRDVMTGETDIKTGFELLVGRWLPIPMYEESQTGQSMSMPNGWCRVKIDPDGERERDGSQNFRLTWAFDTRLAENPEDAKLRPIFLDAQCEKKTYSLCNRVDLLLGNFITIPDGKNDSPVGDYLAAIFGIDLHTQEPHKYKFLAYYIYLINMLRMSGSAPVMTLYHTNGKEIPVDMSIDIGNSRTCAVLFERGDFTKARMLRVRDLSEPWRTYPDAFDMRVVFRRADFGGDITMKGDLFRWNSLVRVGEEAKHLIYRSMENIGEGRSMSYCSSPKRYLWDDRETDFRWENMVLRNDPTNVSQNGGIFIEGFTDHFDDDGKFLMEAKEVDLFQFDPNANKQCHYSRRSLMTFVMIEILQQAVSYINSSEFRRYHGSKECRRVIRRIIVTCPTAMPLEEQRTLRIAARDAAHLMQKIEPEIPDIIITPNPDKLKPSDDPMILAERGWLYDEAFANQLVYLYAELNERYKGRIDHFFQVKGHKRKEMEEMGFENNCLTIGSIDIGAGTTDVMITAFGQKGKGRITPVPLYYDSFYTAGDDILHNIIRDVILEGEHKNVPDRGSIESALMARIQKMTPDEMLTIPLVKEKRIYSDLVEDIRTARDETEARTLRNHLVFQLMHHFFDDNSANQEEKDRRCRLDFCTQISQPIAQFLLARLSEGRPEKIYTYDELFSSEKPAPFLLDHFEHHFGFRFEELTWWYKPAEISNIVRDAMERIFKDLSTVMYAYNCDTIVLSGRPTRLKPITELMLKYIPISPNRMVMLERYRVGTWFPLANTEGYFEEKQKALVAVGAEVGMLASSVGFQGLILDFSTLAKRMKSTACYLGKYDCDLKEVKNPFLTPQHSSALLKGIANFPYFIGCKLLGSDKYQARPIFAIYNNSGVPQINIMLQRNYHEDRELITVEDVTDMEGDTIDKNKIDLRLQTIASDGNHWLDKGAFDLSIQEK